MKAEWDRGAEESWGLETRISRFSHSLASAGGYLIQHKQSLCSGAGPAQRRGSLPFLRAASKRVPLQKCGLGPSYSEKTLKLCDAL